MPQILADFTSLWRGAAQPADLDVDASYWLFIRNSYSGLAALHGIDLWVNKIPLRCRRQPRSLVADASHACLGERQCLERRMPRVPTQRPVAPQQNRNDMPQLLGRGAWRRYRALVYRGVAIGRGGSRKAVAQKGEPTASQLASAVDARRNAANPD